MLRVLRVLRVQGLGWFGCPGLRVRRSGACFLSPPRRLVCDLGQEELWSLVMHDLTQVFRGVEVFLVSVAGAVL